MKDCDLNNRGFKIATMKKLNELKTAQKGSSMSPGIKLMTEGVFYKRD